MRRVEPIGDRIIVKRAEEKEVTKGGLVIPQSAQERPSEGLVIEVGPGRLLESGARSPIMIDKGDTVLFGRYSGCPVELDDVEYVILREDEVLGRERLVVVTAAAIERAAEAEARKDAERDVVLATSA